MKKILSVLTAFCLILCGCTVYPSSSGAAYAGSSDSFHIADLVLLQKYLLGRPSDVSGRDYDLNKDGVWNVFDMVILRRIVINSVDTNEKSEENIMYITIGDTRLTAELADNSSAAAFKELLKRSAFTVDMSDYGNFEKVGSIGTSLPRNDERITTVPGDIILYQGTSITIYYDKNTWNFTRLGKIKNVTQEELKAILGKGNVTAVFSLE